VGNMEAARLILDTDVIVDHLGALIRRVSVLSLDSDSAQHSADIWLALANRGAMIGLADILSAGICLANDLPLLTRNVEHFNRIEGLKLVTPDGLQSYIDAG
jgi:predicted nucleic acid-binding protein